MDRSPRTAAIVVLALLLLLAATLMAGCSQQQPLTVKFADHPTYGKILTDSTGRSLYIQARDVPNTGAVANLGEVGRFYPPFYAESVSGENGINISEFGYLTRADGKRQTTFRGWPLYYYINDKEPGDAKSQGANNITFVAKPDYTIMVRENVTLGIYLTDPAGRPLLAQDTNSSARLVPGYTPFRAAPVIVPSPLVQTGDFGETVGPAGAVQTTYRGRLLYIPSNVTPPGADAPGAGGYDAVIVAPGGTLTGAIETPTATSSTPATTAPAGTTATTARATISQVTEVPARSNDAYTGGEYTPTPFRTVEVIRHDTESPTPSATWTPVSAGQSTVPNTTIPATTIQPTVSPSRTTLIPVTTAAITTIPTSAARTTQVPTIRTTAPTTPPPKTTVITPETTVPVPITTAPRTTLTSPTTLPLPFPIATSRATGTAIPSQGGNGS